MREKNDDPCDLSACSDASDRILLKKNTADADILRKCRRICLCGAAGSVYDWRAATFRRAVHLTEGE
jgi:hypothetical protein